MNGLPSFKHPLLDTSSDNIRVVNILPGHGEENIRCTMRTATLEEEHTALSYVWGSDETSKLIEVDGQKLPVRRNLFEFLARARRWKRRDWFWIDAICIDQSNLEERNHQVRRMFEIYSSAKLVIAWLGYNDQFLEKQWSLLEPRKDPIPLQQAVTMLSLLSTLEYWTRLWVLPEFCAAHHLSIAFSGNLQDFPSFREGLQSCMNVLRARFSPHLPESHQDVAAGYSIINTLLSSRRSYIDRDHGGRSQRRKQKLRKLIVAHSHLRCMDPRDKVYALLSLANDADVELIDYSTATPDLFAQIIRMHQTDDSHANFRFQSTLARALQLGIDTVAACMQPLRMLELTDPFRVVLILRQIDKATDLGRHLVLSLGGSKHTIWQWLNSGVPRPLIYFLSQQRDKGQYLRGCIMSNNSILNRVRSSASPAVPPTVRYLNESTDCRLMRPDGTELQESREIFFVRVNHAEDYFDLLHLLL